MMSASSSLCQCDFIRAQPQIYKDMVKVAKKWRGDYKAKWEPYDTQPKSCFLELLMLRAFQTFTSSLIGTSKLSVWEKQDAIFRHFLELIGDLSSHTFICWNASYEEAAVRQYMQGDAGYAAILPKGPHPVVMDPANPTRNVAVDTPDLKPFILYAKETLGKATGEGVKALQLKIHQQDITIAKMEKQLRFVCGWVSTTLCSPVVEIPVSKLKLDDDKSTHNEIVTLGPLKFKIRLSLMESNLAVAVFLEEMKEWFEQLASVFDVPEVVLHTSCHWKYLQYSSWSNGPNPAANKLLTFRSADGGFWMNVNLIPKSYLSNSFYANQTVVIKLSNRVIS